MIVFIFRETVQLIRTFRLLSNMINLSFFNHSFAKLRASE
ncbi:hypothetical protein BC936DRAFT_142511 [Jimgerdemannia flammicorona]|uniref:Uncharacterized protein n=1 Tax=Jimgerdemannia flammicorona TaxID=994334 RepID=A0A433A0A4_9FUNG|nr:hypothetical protein BC936DRAFT_142511 [Jimgerdemannia flammicorona]